jgi:sugar lactone lactonase YvrE
VALDGSGNTYIADSYFSSQILEVSAGMVTVIAGNGTFGYAGDGGPAIGATLNQPQGIFIDSNGNIFIADTANSVIREVVASTGIIQTVAGNGTAGYSGDGVAATATELNNPQGVYVDSQGNIFIADTENSVIREVIASTGIIQTVAGTPGVDGYSGDGNLATAAQLDLPDGVFVDSSRNIFIADTFNSVIREVTIANSFIQTVVGTQYAWNYTCNYSGDGGPATSAQLCLPNNVFVDASENIYVADTYNSAIREVVAGTIQTVAGNGTACANLSGGCGNNGPAISANLNYPTDVVVDGLQNIFIADSESFEVREVTASNSDIQAFAGNSTVAYSGDGYSATDAELNDPGSVFVDASGNVFIADTSNSAIRVYNPGSSSVTIAGIAIASGDIETVAGNGTACTASTLAGCGDGGLATSAELNYPQGVFVDSAGNIFIADTANSVIREVVATTGDIQTVAGDGTAGFSGDTGPATQAELSSPYGVFVDSAGNIFIADTVNDVIREVTASSGTINTVAGTGGADCNPPSSTCGDGGTATSPGALLSSPAGVFVDATENIYIADTFDNRIREVTASNGIINTVAGTGNEGFTGDGAAATTAELDSPYGVWVDTSGDIFIADTENAAIREVVAATGFIQTVAGILATPAGTSTPGFSGDGGPATSAELNAPLGVFGTSSGTLFIADTDNARIRELSQSLFVTVAPSAATVVVNALQQFTATVTGNSNTNVNWQVNGVLGGNSTVGTISTTGLFTAPATVPTPPTVTIAAISQADNTTTGSAQATIVSPSTTNSVAVTPTPVDVSTSAAQPFSATDNGTATTAVTWYVEGAQGGDTTVGTIDASGNYTAPANVPTPATVIIEAVLQADSTAIGTASVTIVAAPSAAQPAPQTVSPGGTANYSLSLNANTGIPNQPITLSCLQSSLPAGASCTFSPPTVTRSTSPVPFTLAVTVPSGSASLRMPGKSSLVPQLCFAFLPLAGVFLLAKKSRNERWLWLGLLCIFLLALVACGGGGGSSTPPPSSNTYTIKIQGTSTGQPNPVTITTASLTVQ